MRCCGTPNARPAAAIEGAAAEPATPRNTPNEAEAKRQEELARKKEQHEAAELYLDRFHTRYLRVTAVGVEAWIRACLIALDVCLNDLDEAALVANDRSSYTLDKEQQRQFQEEQVKLIAFQRRAFPLLRAAWIKNAREAGWINDIAVAGAGSGTSIVTFTNYRFALNRNIAAAHAAIEDTLKRLRFTEARYQWADVGRYSYYKLEPLPDHCLGVWRPGKNTC